MKRAAGSDDAYLYVSALRELFGLDARDRAGGRGGGEVTELRQGTAGVPLDSGGAPPEQADARPPPHGMSHPP